MYIFISKCRIRLRTLIFIPYDSQRISIIDPVTGSSNIIRHIYDTPFEKEMQLDVEESPPANAL